ncbi:MAG: hypothetical protein AB1716_16850 [Planctomycetota bacterium]
MVAQWMVWQACGYFKVGENYTWISLTILLYSPVGLLSGFCLRYLVRRVYSFERVLLATPGFYWFFVFFLLQALAYVFGSNSTDAIRIGALGLLLSWPFTALVFIVGNPRFRSSDTAAKCSKCGYNLTGNVSGVCPECGTRIVAAVKR